MEFGIRRVRCRNFGLVLLSPCALPYAVHNDVTRKFGETVQTQPRCSGTAWAQTASVQALDRVPIFKKKTSSPADRSVLDVPKLPHVFRDSNFFAEPVVWTVLELTANRRAEIGSFLCDHVLTSFSLRAYSLRLPVNFACTLTCFGRC